jgi:hypothetical protein
MENDLKDKCAMEYSNQSIEYSFEKIDSYLRNFSSFNQKKNLAKVRIKKNFLSNFDCFFFV